MHLKKKIFYIIISMFIGDQAVSPLYSAANTTDAIACQLYIMIKKPHATLKDIVNRIKTLHGKGDAYIEKLFLHSPYDVDRNASTIGEILSESLFEDILIHMKRTKSERLAIAKELWNLAPHIASKLEIDGIPLSLDLFRKIKDEDIFKDFYSFLLQEHPDALRKKMKDGKNIFHIMANHRDLVLNTYPQRQLRMKWLIQKPLINISSLVNEKDKDGNTPLHLLFGRDTTNQLDQAYVHDLTKTFLQNGADLSLKNNNDTTPLDQASSLSNYDQLRKIISENTPKTDDKTTQYDPIVPSHTSPTAHSARQPQPVPDITPPPIKSTQFPQMTQPEILQHQGILHDKSNYNQLVIVTLSLLASLTSIIWLSKKLGKTLQSNEEKEETYLENQGNA